MLYINVSYVYAYDISYANQLKLTNSRMSKHSRILHVIYRVSSNWGIFRANLPRDMVTIASIINITGLHIHIHHAY